MEIEKNGSVINAIAERKTNFNRFKNMGIYFTIIVPREMSCNVSSSGGGLKISGVEGTHNFKSSGGSVILENTAGTTRAKSSGGKVKATNHMGDIHLTSSGGGVHLKNIHDLSSSRVKIELQNFSGRSEKDRVKGTMNEGGIPVYVRASGGSVKVRYED